MSKKVKIIWGIVLLVVIASSITLYALGKHKKEKDPVSPTNEINSSSSETTLNTLDKPPHEVDVPEKAHVFVVKNNKFTLESSSQLEVTTGKIGDKLKKEIRFIILPDDTKLSENDKKQLKQWIKDKKMVLFVGGDVDGTVALEQLGVNKKEIKVQANADLYHNAYGYGYSYGYRANMPLFMMTNSKEENDMISFLPRFLYENRGF